MTDAFRKQSEADLDGFLRLRAREFALNGLLLVIVPGTLGDSCVGDGLFSCLWDAAAELAGRERIDASLLEDLIMPVYFMTEDVSPALACHKRHFSNLNLRSGGVALYDPVCTACWFCTLIDTHLGWALGEPDHGLSLTGDGGGRAQIGLLGGAAARWRFTDPGRSIAPAPEHSSLLVKTASRFLGAHHTLLVQNATPTGVRVCC